MVGSINELIKKFFQDIAADPVEGRVVEYVIREVRNGRHLMDVIEDPFVKNRLSEEKLRKVFENPEVIDALEDEIRSAFQSPDIGVSH